VLGPFADSAFVTEQGPALRRGDLLVLFTDGVTEAEAADGRIYCYQWALDVVRAHAHRSPAEILEALCDAIKVFADGAAQRDDVTAVVCRVRD